ncbi:hypothetical protein BDZ91DRAFT_727927 [Kalaharituber pfeilii]|nr:hypothetical protein BDZ91DRAFT_727927 [Kalaharituber pfeilii]
MTATESVAVFDGEAAPGLAPGRKLWEHPDPESTALFEFKQHISRKYNVEFGSETDPNSLWQWSVDNLSDFWSEVWDFTKIQAVQQFDSVVDASAPMYPRPAFFSGAKLNYANNLLYPALPIDENSTAVISATELHRSYVSWKELRERVRDCAAAMKPYVQVGDRVVGYVANDTNALVAMLAAASLGCIWSGISPDHGSTAVLDRLTQLEPSLLFASNAVIYNGKAHDAMQKIDDVVSKLDGLRAVVVFQNGADHPTPVENLKVGTGVRAFRYDDFLNTVQEKNGPLVIEQFDADHPLFILFSSGTTGEPKCICHGSIGTLIQHKKEHMIHTNMKPGDVFFQFTTVTWMMWHWLVSGLASGMTIVLYDGSPFRPLIDGSGDLAMPKLIEELGVNHFGTSAKYLSVLEQNNAEPKSKFPLTKLKTIFSTGAVLGPSTFEYVYQAFGPNVHLASITGGTDIISLFGAPSTLVPVYSGEIQCLGLGMKVESWDIDGKNVDFTGEAGDLICTKPFPSMPVKFWGIQGATAYKKSYFTTYPNVWHHGDFIKLLPRTRGLLMLGRSDGILKPAGVRFGSAEIYNLLLSHFPHEVEDALCIGRRRQNVDLDETVVLFVKMMPTSESEFGESLVSRIKEIVRRELSQRHVPGVVEQCWEIPVTTNGKKVEVAVKQILCGLDVKVSASVANAECLEWYREWARTH